MLHSSEINNRRVLGTMKSFSTEHCASGLKDIGRKMLPICLTQGIKTWFEEFGIKLLGRNQVRDLLTIDKLAYVIKRAFIDVTVGFLAVISFLHSDEIDLNECSLTNHSGWLYLRDKFSKWENLDFTKVDIKKEVTFKYINPSLTDPRFILRHLFNLRQSSRVPITLYWGLWSEWRKANSNSNNGGCRQPSLDPRERVRHFTSRIKESIYAWDTKFEREYLMHSSEESI